jgi:seryl-tRNA synthetase
MSNSSSTTTTSETIEEYDLPPYDACFKPSYTKQNIEEFKIQLQGIEEELLNIKPNDIRKPQLRRQAADLEEIIINFENTEPKPEIIQLLNDNIELLSEYVDLEEISHWGYIDKINYNLFKDDVEWPYRNPNDISKTICKDDINLFIKFLKKNFPIYSNAIEKNCNEASIKLLKYCSSNYNFDALISLTKEEIKTQGIAAQARRNEIKHFIDETQLNFNKKLSSFIENIIDEKKQMEDKITELDNKVNTLIKHCNKYAMPSNPLVMD